MNRKIRHLFPLPTTETPVKPALNYGMKPLTGLAKPVYPNDTVLIARAHSLMYGLNDRQGQTYRPSDFDPFTAKQIIDWHERGNTIPVPAPKPWEFVHSWPFLAFIAGAVLVVGFLRYQGIV